MKKKIQQKLFFFLKIAITITILIIIFRKIDLAEVFQNFTRINLIVLFLLVITAVFKIYLQYKNWGNYLQMNPDYELNPREIFRSLMIGDALRFLIPGGYAVAGKVYYLNNKKAASLVSVVLEKFMQIWTSLLFAAFAVIFYFTEISLWIRISFFIVVLLIPVFLSIFLKLFKDRSIFFYLRNYDRSIFPILLIQFLFYIITLFQFYLILTNFETIDVWSVVIAIPLIFSANLIPFSYAGLGFKETFAVAILAKYNIPAEVAVTSTLVIFFLNTFLPALLGLYYILSSRSGKEQITS